MGLDKVLTLSVMDWWTQQDEGRGMSFDELVMVLVSKLFSWLSLTFQEQTFPGARREVAFVCSQYCLTGQVGFNSQALRTEGLL